MSDFDLWLIKSPFITFVDNRMHTPTNIQQSTHSFQFTRTKCHRKTTQCIARQSQLSTKSSKFNQKLHHRRDLVSIGF